MSFVSNATFPLESTTWLHVALAIFAAAFAAGCLALTQTDRVSISVGELWIICGSLTVIGLVCLIAHWDSNRGRKVKQADVVEEWEEPYKPGV